MQAVPPAFADGTQTLLPLTTWQDSPVPQAPFAHGDLHTDGLPTQSAPLAQTRSVLPVCPQDCPTVATSLLQAHTPCDVPGTAKQAFCAHALFAPGLQGGWHRPRSR